MRRCYHRHLPANFIPGNWFQEFLCRRQGHVWPNRLPWGSIRECMMCGRREREGVISGDGHRQERRSWHGNLYPNTLTR